MPETKQYTFTPVGQECVLYIIMQQSPHRYPRRSQKRVRKYVDETFVKGGFGRGRDAFDREYDGQTYNDTFSQPEREELDEFIVSDDEMARGYASDDDYDHTSDTEEERDPSDGESSDDDMPCPPTKRRRAAIIDSDTEEESVDNEYLVDTNGVDTIEEIDQQIQNTQEDQLAISAFPMMRKKLWQQILDFQQTVEQLDAEYVAKNTKIAEELFRLMSRRERLCSIKSYGPFVRRTDLKI